MEVYRRRADILVSDYNSGNRHYEWWGYLFSQPTSETDYARNTGGDVAGSIGYTASVGSPAVSAGEEDEDEEEEEQSVVDL